MKYCENYNAWEKAMLDMLDMLNQGKIKDNGFQVRYKNDNTLVDYTVTPFYIVSVTNLRECVKKKTSCYIKDIYIPKLYRNRGYGKLVLQDVKRMCKIMGVDSIETEPINKKSADFFIKNGFVDMKNFEVRRLKLNL